MKEAFNPEDWLPKQPSHPSIHPSVNSSDNSSDIEHLVTRIEAELTDIAPTYADWVNLGFAFASELGEAGRTFFHRVSRFYNGYTKGDTDKQYDQCLHAHGHGITISTFFFLARQAGIELKEAGSESQEAGSMGHGAWSESQEAGSENMGTESESKEAESTGQGAGSESPKAGGESQEAGSENKGAESESKYGHDKSCPCPLPSSSPSPLSSSPTSLPEEELPTLPDELFPTLPEFLQRVVERSTSKEERDILLMGALTTLSSCLYKVFGIYDDKKVFPNLYLYVTAKASAGKGRLVLCKKLVYPIHGSLREQARTARLQYEMEMREFNLVKNKDLSTEKPQKPPEKLLFIPANSSSTGMFQLLGDNDGRGLIFETEGDTLAQAFKTDYGNYSDGFRKAFHHETITYYRRTDREYVEIVFPCVSCVLSGTPRQVAILIPNAENGLFSRFMFYYMNLNPVWKNVFLHGDRPLDDHFNELGKEFYSLFKSLNESHEIEFCLTLQQEEAFHNFFSLVHEKYLLLQGIDYLATIRRLGLNAFRICMILSALRLMETGDFPGRMYCREDDFQSALAIIGVLVRHASHVYSELPEEVKLIKPRNKKEMFLEGLPEKFSHKEFLELAKTLDINERTAQRYMSAFCEKGLIIKVDFSAYRKQLPLNPGKQDER